MENKFRPGSPPRGWRNARVDMSRPVKVGESQLELPFGNLSRLEELEQPLDGIKQFKLKLQDSPKWYATSAAAAADKYD